MRNPVPLSPRPPPPARGRDTGASGPGHGTTDHGPAVRAGPGLTACEGERAVAAACPGGGLRSPSRRVGPAPGGTRSPSECPS